MTRAEAHESMWCGGYDDNTTEIIDEIYNDFEAMCCSNCKYYEEDWCNNLHNEQFVLCNDTEDTQAMQVTKDFSCREWTKVKSSD